MAKPENESPINRDEFTRIFDEYRAKIDEITRKTEENLQSIKVTPDVADDLDSAVDIDSEEPEEALPQVQPEPTEKSIEVIWPSDKESVEIIKEAKRKAHQLISQAENNIKKEAKKKTRAQVEKIIASAKKEAEDIIARAHESAEKERNDAIATVKYEAEQLIREITEQCRDETQEHSSKVIAAAREKAEKMMAEIITSSNEINHLVTKIIDRAKNTINEFEERLQKETGELARAITETQNKLEQATMIEDEEEITPESPARSNETDKNPSLTVHLIGDKEDGGKGSHSLFSGQVEMKSSSAVDYQYLRNLKKYLVHMPSIKYLQEYASEKEMSVMFDVREPVPLLEILNNVPLVDEVITETDDDICIIFKNSE